MNEQKANDKNSNINNESNRASITYRRRSLPSLGTPNISSSNIPIKESHCCPCRGIGCSGKFLPNYHSPSQSSPLHRRAYRPPPLFLPRRVLRSTRESQLLSSRDSTHQEDTESSSSIADTRPQQANSDSIVGSRSAPTKSNDSTTTNTGTSTPLSATSPRNSPSILEMTDISDCLAVNGTFADASTVAYQIRLGLDLMQKSEIKLQNVSIDQQILDAFRDLLETSPRRIWKKLDLMHCTGLLPQVFQAVCRSGNVEHVAFTGSVPIAHNPRYSLTDECLRALSFALQPSDTNNNTRTTKVPLQSLCLRGTRIPRQGLEELCLRGLGNPNCPLTSLRLSSLHLQAHDIPLLASALSTNRQLQVLLLAHCKLTTSIPTLLQDQGVTIPSDQLNDMEEIVVVDSDNDGNDSDTRRRPRKLAPTNDGSSAVVGSTDERTLALNDRNSADDTVDDTTAAPRLAKNQHDGEQQDPTSSDPRRPAQEDSVQTDETSAITMLLEALEHHPSLQCLMIYGMKMAPCSTVTTVTRATANGIQITRRVQATNDEESRNNRAIKALSRLLQSPTCKLWHLGLKQNVDQHQSIRTNIVPTRAQGQRRNQDQQNVQRSTPQQQEPQNGTQSLSILPIIEALRTNRTLRYFQCSGNGVTSQEMERLSEVLANVDGDATPPVLNGLGLTANAIGDAGLTALSKHLGQMRCLKYMDLQRNPFTSKGKRAVIKALSNNWTLERLDLDGKPNPMKSYYLALNRGGRRLLLQSSPASTPNVGGSGQEQNTSSPVPLGLWPVVLARANQLQFGRSTPNAQLDVLYCLIRGPALFERPTKGSSTPSTTAGPDTAETYDRANNTADKLDVRATVSLASKTDSSICSVSEIDEAAYEGSGILHGKRSSHTTMDDGPPTKRKRI